MSGKSAGTGERMVTLDVSLLGRDYKVACKEGEEAELMDAVAFLDRRMREIRDSSKTTSVERIAVMAALESRARFPARARRAGHGVRRWPASAESIDAAAARRRIAGMQSAIDQVLAGQEKLL